MPRRNFESLERGSQAFELTKAVRNFLLDHDNMGLRLMGTPSDDADAMLDLSTYQIRINQINDAVEHALRHLRETLGLAAFSYAVESERQETYEKYVREQQVAMPLLAQITRMMHHIGGMETKSLAALNGAMSGELYEQVLTTAMRATEKTLRK